MLLIQLTPSGDKIEDMPTSAIQTVYAQVSSNHCDSE
jgi:hypothetical protein